MLSSTLYPLHVLASLPTNSYHALKNFWGNDAKNQGGRDEVRTLRAQMLALQTQLQKMVVLETENQRLRELLASTSRVIEKPLMAEIISVDLDPFSHKVLINKGSIHHVTEGQPVLDAHGILGQILHVSKFSSTVILLTDPSHAIPVQINRNGLRTLVKGMGVATKLQVSFIPNNADIKEGDLLVTSGLGQRFPKGYPVGTVKSIHLDPSQPYLSVTATPAAGMETSREVVIIQKYTTIPSQEAVMPERVDANTN